MVDHGECTSLITMHADARGVPFLVDGAPRAHGAGVDELRVALRTDLGPFELVPAAPVNRHVRRDEAQPIPETCLPYRQANRLGYVLRNRLPFFFVRNRHGELLADPRTALAYALSRPRHFGDELAAIRAAVPAVLVPPGARRDVPSDVVAHIAQPYHAFTNSFFGIPTGVYASSPAGTGLYLGPLMNRVGPLPLRAGVVESDWHRREVFLVTDAPEFDGDRLLIPAGRDIGQCWFVTYEQATTIEVRHQVEPPADSVAYDQLWRDTTTSLGDEGRGLATHTAGVRTVSLECVHCRMSLPDAADDPDPAHSWDDLYVPTYKTLRRQLQPNPTRGGPDVR